MKSQLTLLIFLIIPFFNVDGQVNGRATLPELIPYRKGNLWGYCDSNKRLLIQPQFEHARPFINDFAEVRIDSTREGIIDKAGKIIVSVGKDTTVWVSENSNIYVRFYDKDIIIKVKEKNENWFQPTDYVIDEWFSKGIFIVRKDRKYGIVTTKGKKLLPFKFEDISPPDERGYVRLKKKNGRITFVDSSLKKKLLTIPAKYDVRHFREDLAAVSLTKKKNSLTGFINRSGEIKIPLIYKNTSIFINGLCEVSSGLKTGFIDIKGDTIISFKYGSPVNLRNGFINYREPLISTLYDLKDKEIIKLKSYDIDYINDSLIIVSKYGLGPLSSRKYGIVNIKGEEIWPITYHSIYTNLYPCLIYVLESWNKRPYYMDYKFNKYYED